LLPLVLFTGFVLFAPSWILDTFGLTRWIDSYRQYFGLAFLLSSVFFVSGLAMGGLDSIKRWRRKRRANKELEQTLRRLSEPEKAILRGYIDNSTTTRYLSLGDGVVGGLEAQHILYRSSHAGNVGAWAYNIQPWAWEYLNSRPHLLK
jgi:hypothetical protein